MSTIHQSHLIDSIADSLQFMSYYHPLDFIHSVNAAYEREESQAAKAAMAQILINSRMCAQGRRPICQDTGIVTVFVNVGMDVRWDAEMSVTEMINEGVRRAYTHPENVLRASILRDPAGIRKNTGDNTPAVIHYDMVPGDKVEVHIAAKGGGSENKAKLVIAEPLRQHRGLGTRNCSQTRGWLVPTGNAWDWDWRNRRKSGSACKKGFDGPHRHP